MRQRLRQLPHLLRTDAQLRFLSIASLCGPTIFILVPFAAVYATEVTGRGESFVGLLVIAKTVGLFFGNLVGGYLGDQRGGRLPLLLSRVSRFLFCLGIPFATTEPFLLGLFFVYGMSFTLNMVGNQVLALEISPDGRRPTYLGIISMATFAGILFAPTLSSGIRMVSGEIWPLALASAIGTVVSGAAIYRMTEPRVRYPSGYPG
jgi:MFS family permease